MSSVAIPLQPNQRQGRLILALIVVLLALPFAIGAGLYFGGWQPPTVSPHGHLLNPPIQLPEQIQRSTGKNGEKWNFLLRVHGPCAAECINRLDEMRRIHVALYKNMGRVSRTVLTDQPDDPALLALRDSQPDLLLLPAQSSDISGVTDPLLIIDPQGQVIMTYPADASAQGVRADLERLLKFTSNG
jgi:hypothetical protein